MKNSFTQEKKGIMTEHDLNDSSRILASISNGNGAPSVMNMGRPNKSQNPVMTSDDIQSTLGQTQSQNQALAHPPPPQPQQQQSLHHHPHHLLSVQNQGSQPLSAPGGNAGSGGAIAAGSAVHVQEGTSVNGNAGVQPSTGAFNLGLGHLPGVPTPTSHLLQQQAQQQQQQHQHQQFLMIQQQQAQQQIQQQQQQQQQQEEHQRQLQEIQEQEQRRLQQQGLQQQQNQLRQDPPQGEEILIPNQEQEFESLEAAQQAAERYARSVNTVVIVKRTTKDKHGNVVQKDLACERQGSYIGSLKKAPDASIRTKRCGCPWMISVGFSKKRGNRDGKRGRFTKVTLEHNHPLQPLPDDIPMIPSKLTIKETRVPPKSNAATSNSRTQSSRNRPNALASSSTAKATANSGRSASKRASAKSNASARNIVENSAPLDDYGMPDFLPQEPIISSNRVSVLPPVTLPELQSSRNALAPLAGDVMSALENNGRIDENHAGPSMAPGTIMWEDLKAQMDQIPWDLQQGAMKAMMEVLYLTRQSFQIPTIGGARNVDAEASAAATAAAIADVVGSLPANYNSNPQQSQQPQPPSQQQQQQQPQPQQHQQQQNQQQQRQQLHPPSFARHHNLSGANTASSAMEGIPQGLAAAASTSDLLQLHRADVSDLNGGNIRNKGHSRQGSNTNAMQVTSTEGHANMMPGQPPTSQMSTAIPAAVSSFQSTAHSVASATAPSTPTSSLPMSTNVSPLLTPQPTLRNSNISNLPLPGDASVHHHQGGFIHHSRQSSHSNHHRSLSASSVSMAAVGTGVHALDSNATPVIASHTQTNGNSGNASMESSPMLPQAMTNITQTRAQVQAQVPVDTNADAVTAALAMNMLPGSNPVSSSTYTGSVSHAVSSPISLGLLEDSVRLNGLDPAISQQLQMQHYHEQQQQQQHQQRMQMLQQQQQQQQQHHHHQQQQQGQQGHGRISEEDGDINELPGEPSRKRIKS
ncbi:hypothetical protein BGX27_009663 [Mortierella sp. AM989]|nr:hypothetical protein BGX27_009663 [Mortierella sp. AM989]